MARKINKHALKARADKLFSAYIRSSGACEWCGKRDDTLQAAHVFSRRFMVTRYNEDNCVCLCAVCHFRAHAEPVEFTEFIKQFLGEKDYNALRRKAKTCIKKVDLNEIIKKYQELND